MKREELKPWDQPVELQAILDELVASNRRYIYQPESWAYVDAMYVLLTYCYVHFEYCPIILITSPLYGCGKTRKLDWYEVYCNNPEMLGNTTQSYLFRTAEVRHPTFLIDEFDSQPMESRLAIMNVLNNGYQRGKPVARTDQAGTGLAPKTFDTYGPKVVACINADKFNATTTSRSINFRMQRKPRSITVERLRKLDGTELKRKCLRWCEDNEDRIKQLATTRIKLPDEMSDRQQDTWEALATLSTFAGSTWENRIWNAALELHNSCKDDTISWGERLLLDLREYFEEMGKDRYSSEELITHLNNNAGWGDYAYNKGISKHKLSNLLRDFDIHPEVIHFPEKGEKLRGYYASGFDKVFRRYLEPLDPDENRNSVTQPDNTGLNGETTVTDNVTQTVTLSDSERHIKAVSQ